MRADRTFEDFVQTTLEVSTESELQSVFTRAIAAEGFENQVFTSIGANSLVQVHWYQLPSGYAETYVSQQWERIDPVLGLSLSQSIAFTWSEQLARVELSRAQRGFLGACRELAVVDGVVFPMHAPGRPTDVISISRRDTTPVDGRRLPLLRALVAQTWYRFQDMRSSRRRALASEPVRLTAREVEVLKWVKVGKTNRDIAEIFGISVKAVEFHIANILRKTGAANRVGAVVVALTQGILSWP